MKLSRCCSRLPGRILPSANSSNSRTPGVLSQLFASLLNMKGEEKKRMLSACCKKPLDREQGEPWQTIRLIAEFYPDDSGLFSPLLLNVVKLNPGEAMFLFAETPHAYLQGRRAGSDGQLR